MNRILRLLLAAAAFCQSDLNAQIAHLTLQSQPGDWIGQGLNYDITFTPANSDFFLRQVRNALPTGQPTEIVFALGGQESTPFSLLFFGTDQLGIPMQPGTYVNAQRADFASLGHPGLDVSFDGRGCNTLTGQFTVTDFTYSPSLGIQSFSASFEQHCEGVPPALFGTFTYQAVPEPSTHCIFGLAFVGFVSLSRYRKPVSERVWNWRP